MISWDMVLAVRNKDDLGVRDCYLLIDKHDAVVRLDVSSLFELFDSSW